MRRHMVWVGCAAIALALAACSSGSKSTTVPSPSTTSSSVAVTTTPPTTIAPSSTTTGAAAATTTTTTTTAGCPQGGSTTPVSTPVSKASSLLTTVTVASTACTDRVIFGFIAKTGGKPSCTVAYENGPFTTDGSGVPVTVAGAAFVVVRCSPAYGYDFESGRTTYTGPKRITPSGSAHVRALAETGDFEGVVSWLIGLDGRRPFRVVTTTIPPGVSNLTITFF